MHGVALAMLKYAPDRRQDIKVEEEFKISKTAASKISSSPDAGRP